MGETIQFPLFCTPPASDGIGFLDSARFSKIEPEVACLEIRNVILGYEAAIEHRDRKLRRIAGVILECRGPVTRLSGRAGAPPLRRRAG
jgi:hypothetical protein